MLLKINNYKVEIKGRGCAYGRKNQNWISKEDTSSPTVSTDLLMISCMINTPEGWYVTTDDISGDLPQTE